MKITNLEAPKPRVKTLQNHDVIRLMKSFDIEITETLQRTVSVAADSREEAEQMVDDGWHNGDYVLDSEDFIDVDFKTVGEGEKEMSKSKKELDALLVKPNEYPQKVTIGAELKDLQEAVGGTITAVYPFADPVAIVCNDEGKLLGLPMNRALRDEHGQTYDVLTGSFLVVGLGKEDFASLSPELAQKYEQHFHQPETFIKLGGHLVILPTPDEAVQPTEEKPRAKPPAEHDR